MLWRYEIFDWAHQLHGHPPIANVRSTKAALKEINLYRLHRQGVSSDIHVYKYNWFTGYSPGHYIYRPKTNRLEFMQCYLGPGHYEPHASAIRRIKLEELKDRIISWILKICNW